MVKKQRLCLIGNQGLIGFSVPARRHLAQGMLKRYY